MTTTAPAAMTTIPPTASEHGGDRAPSVVSWRTTGRSVGVRRHVTDQRRRVLRDTARCGCSGATPRHAGQRARRLAHYTHAPWRVSRSTQDRSASRSSSVGLVLGRSTPGSSGDGVAAVGGSVAVLARRPRAPRDDGRHGTVPRLADRRGHPVHEPDRPMARAALRRFGLSGPSGDLRQRSSPHPAR